ncbi:MAG TPA: homoserine kinase [Gemmatimonadales bacterium]|jgi:homoserine kinase|nr:homoserine kinase [Gemmatimonadales bacterium]
MPAQVRVFAPGSVGNVGPGFDILGLAVDGAGDTVLAQRVEQPGVRIAEPGHPELPTNPASHTSGIAATEVLRRAGVGWGLELRVEKGLPLAGGQGGSAASAVAGALAANLLLDHPLERAALLAAALEAEAVVSGRHADNIVAILLGGLVLIRSLQPLELIRLPVPPALRVVLAHPHHPMPTRTGRAVLPAQLSREDAVHQAAQVGALVAAAHSGDLDLLGRAIEDRIAEPVRAPLLPGFSEAKRAALTAGALGCSISGSGPSSFALVRDLASGAAVADAMEQAYRRSGVPCTARVAAPDLAGARAL